MKDYVEMRNGGYYIAGKRVSLDSIVYAYQRGQAPESIKDSFAFLTLEEVYGALAFYLANQQEVDRLILEDEVDFEKEVSAQRMARPDWFARMDAARSELMVQR